MVDILLGMAGSLIVLSGFAFGHWMGLRAGRKDTAYTVKDGAEKEKQTAAMPIEQQFENMMRYSGGMSDE